MTNNSMTDKVALVVGGSSGIGRATAIAFAKKGAKVVVASRGEKNGEETVSLVEQAGSEGVFIQTDVSKRRDVEALIEQAVERFGRIDFAFNNAGIEGKVAPLIETEEADFDTIVGVNLKGVYLGLKYQIAAMLKSGGGAIVNTSSIGGIVGFSNTAIYCATKQGVIGLTKTAAIEVAQDNIRVNAIAPGAVQTDLLKRMSGSEEAAEGVSQAIPVGRVSNPEEIANAVVWLCSKEASYVTGHTLVADGGFTIQ